jgi:hypothetical protein
MRLRLRLEHILSIVILGAVALGVGSNIKQQMDIDHSKLPLKLEQSKGFQRWITNMKNKDVEINADEFKLLEETEIFNSKWTKVYSSDDETAVAALNQTLAEAEEDKTKGIVFSPSKREILDYRPIVRGAYDPLSVRFYGQKDDKIIETRVAGCFNRENCYFDRAFFLDNDVMGVSEISLAEKVPCDINTVCKYTYKMHLIDFKNNNKAVYGSEVKELNLSQLIPRL